MGLFKKRTLPVPALERGHLRLTAKGLEINREWSADEFRSLQARIDETRSHGYYQNIVISDRTGKTLHTPGTHMTSAVMPVLEGFGFPRSLAGQTVLDIGCNAGFYAVSCWLRGATRVVGLDHQPHYVNQALLVRDTLGLKESDIDFRVADGHGLSPESEKFDFVVNTGVVYHLENPMDFLRKVAGVTRHTMYLESEMLTDPKFTEHAWFLEREYGGDPSNWWIYGPKCLERMVRAAGFQDVQFAGFIWRPAPGTRTPEGMLRQGRGVLICRKQALSPA
jgi:2-polyprenyl-3-methyl-5-hydroxy-6-metoxy-1,4-benzoquinol methylase